MSEIDNHLSKKYDVHKRLGKGAYGIVWKAKSRRSGRIVAIKKIFDAFRNRTDAQRTFREIIFLKEFNNHPNIIRLLNVHKADNDRDLYLVFEYMSTDLHHVIRKGNILRDIHKEYIMYQLFQATAYIHSGNVIHRDQKPSNILLDSECRCKIADFGLARSLSSTELEENQDCLTDYVATRWYRAPEILLGYQKYTKGVDMWSLGCILGEMIIGKPLFPGKSTMDQIEHIARLLGNSQLLKLKKICSSQTAQLVGKMISKHSVSKWSSTIKEKYPEGIDLLQKLLLVTPDDRITAPEAIKHKYVTKFYNKKHDYHLNYDVVPPFNDNVQLSVDQYRRKLYDIIKGDKTNQGM
ncbi:mitogen-activated protein kinase 15 [Lepeophtheirus salmonis]|uniref:mitogen-activated protein kinase 15 n=1 Tax=Lepeophtheirus salmonis TaxID=72036 RepID=UPI001AE8C135|nr:mitogen-activated protein kinase 15-like [Lepeophtheirus salmonis]